MYYFFIISIAFKEITVTAEKETIVQRHEIFDSTVLNYTLLYSSTVLQKLN